MKSFIPVQLALRQSGSRLGNSALWARIASITDLAVTPSYTTVRLMSTFLLASSSSVGSVTSMCASLIVGQLYASQSQMNGRNCSLYVYASSGSHWQLLDFGRSLICISSGNRVFKLLNRNV